MPDWLCDVDVELVWSDDPVVLLVWSDELDELLVWSDELDELLVWSDELDELLDWSDGADGEGASPVCWLVSDEGAWSLGEGDSIGGDAEGIACTIGSG